MSYNLPKCPHVASVHYSDLDLKQLEKPTACANCDYAGINLWICLYQDCHYIGCSDQANDHSTKHFSLYKHAVHMNLSSQRVWCYLCERELFQKVQGNISEDNPFSYALSMFTQQVDDGLINHNSGNGLIGLQNITNTCYMNSALQALSNLMPMTHYFLHCSSIVQHIVEQSMPRCKAAGLAKSYQRLIYDIWANHNISRDYITPRGILYGIRTIHPMFRGYMQHDTQEFLRCFMDLLHDELKEQHNLPSKQNNSKVKELDETNKREDVNDDDDEKLSNINSITPNDASDSEYETCESTFSERETSNSLEPEKLLISCVGEIKKQKHLTRMFALSQQPHQRSIISDVFDGKLLSSVQCYTCDRISSREETFQDLSLPIPNREYVNVLHQVNSPSVQSLNSSDLNVVRGNDGWISWMLNIFRSWLYGPSVTLYDCMASFFSADELKGDNMYSCEKCNKLRTGVKYSRILDLPEVLCIHLKRFRHDLSYSSKINTYVYFPLEGLEMGLYLHKDCQSKVSIYNLSSVICHHGTVGSGHYTCYARNVINGRWYEFDDHFVTEVSTETVQNCQAYVLFYQKHNPQMDLIREEARNLANSHPCQTVDIEFYISREWLSRLATFAEPGPINNHSMLCPHGGIQHSKIELISQLAISISQPVWDFLYHEFGGGPAINMLFECEICKRDAEALARRQYYELAVFTKYNCSQIELDSAGAIYAISMEWLRQWQQFSRGLTCRDPGPITNNDIIAEPNVGQLPVTSSILGVRTGSDYAQLNAPLWRFLHDIYGGGPEILIRGPILDKLEIVDLVENNKDNVIDSQDFSDTESYIGQHSTPELEISKEITEAVNSALPILNVNSSSPKKTASIKDPKYNRTYVANTKRLKIKSLHSSSLRKKSKRNRDTLKHADMFGSKGIYNATINEVTKDVAGNDGKDAVNATHIVDKAFKNVSNTPFHEDNIIVTEKKVSLHSKDKLRNKEKVVLRKFITLPDSSESNETDI